MSKSDMWAFLVQHHGQWVIQALIQLVRLCWELPTYQYRQSWNTAQSFFFLHTKLFQTRFDPYGWQLNIKSIKKLHVWNKLTITQSGILYEHVGNIRPLLLTMDNLSGQLYTRNKSCR